jgi:fructose-bisphosphate aldolase / 2-amino-3,7-dideoxy-D-threo-hept-6-ulosonate synthase
METGKAIRMHQILAGDKRTFIIAIDQVIPRGLNTALSAYEELLSHLFEYKFDALLMHSGPLKKYGTLIARQRIPIILKLTTTTIFAKDRTNRFQVDDVERAVSLGCSAVAANLYIGVPEEIRMLEQFYEISKACDQWGMPLVAMANPSPDFEFDHERLAYVCRVAFELGADIVKTDYSGSIESFKYVVSSSPIPIVVEESPHPVSREGTLSTVREVVEAGGAGVMFGERVWGEHGSSAIVQDIYELIHRCH